MGINTIGVIYGGLSCEDRHYIESCPQEEWSASLIVKALRRLGYQSAIIDPRDKDFLEKISQVDCAIINCHGPLGEDGVLQGYLDYCHVPYALTGVLGSAVGMDKFVSKLVARGLGMRVPNGVLAGEDELTVALCYPCLVKACDGGSSMGMQVVRDEDECGKAVASLRDDGYRRLLVEEHITGVSATVSLVRGDSGAYVELPILRCPSGDDYYDLATKDGSTAEDYSIFPECELRNAEQLMKSCELLYEALNCRGFVRMDFIIDRHGVPWFLEINTVPGMQANSNLPLAAAMSGIEYDELVDLMVKSLRDK